MLKMAGPVGRIFRKLAINMCNTNVPQTSSLSSLQIMVPCFRFERTLFSKASLGLDGFELQRERTIQQLSNLEAKFKTRMKEYADDEKNMIFTEDLKNMVHLANSDDDVELVVAMIKRFNKQNKQLRFGNFKFGPIVMRLFHLRNKPELAIQCFKSEEFEGFFDQLITYQVYLDLLYENKMYQEILDSFDLIRSRQVEGAMFPRNSIVLVLAACYKLNNAESWNYTCTFWKNLEKAGYYPTRRAVTFCAALALNQGDPKAALEILAIAKNPGYTTVRNIKALTLAELGRLDDVIPILKSVLQEDTAAGDIHTFNRDVVEKIKERVLKEDNPELSVEFNRIEQLFQKQGHISEKTLDEQLCSEIQNPPLIPKQQYQQGGYSNRQWQNYGNRDQRYNNYQNNRNRQRPGLKDLV